MEFRYAGFCEGRKTGEPGEKPSEQGENQQQTRPTEALCRNGTQATLVGGEGSHQCAIPAPQILKSNESTWNHLVLNGLHTINTITIKCNIKESLAIYVVNMILLLKIFR